MDPQLEAAQRNLAAQVMGRPGVIGTAIGEKGGEPCLKVYVADDRAGKTVPRKVGGFPVVIEVTGSIRRL